MPNSGSNKAAKARKRRERKAVEQKGLNKNAKELGESVDYLPPNNSVKYCVAEAQTGQDAIEQKQRLSWDDVLDVALDDVLLDQEESRRSPAFEGTPLEQSETAAVAAKQPQQQLQQPELQQSDEIRLEEVQLRVPAYTSGHPVAHSGAIFEMDVPTGYPPSPEPPFVSDVVIHQMQWEIKKLLGKNSSLQSENDSMLKKNTLLQRENDSMLKENALLARENERFSQNNEQLKRAAAEARSEYEMLEQIHQPVHTENEQRKWMLADMRKVALEMSWKRQDLDFPTKRMGELDCAKLYELGVSVEGISELQQVLCDPSFHPWRTRQVKPGSEEVETVTNWDDQRLQTILRKYDCCSGGRGRDVAQEVLHCSKELQDWNPSGGYCVTIPYHHGECRELRPDELLKIAAGVRVAGAYSTQTHGAGLKAEGAGTLSRPPATSVTPIRRGGVPRGRGVIRPGADARVTRADTRALAAGASASSNPGARRGDTQWAPVAAPTSNWSRATGEGRAIRAW
jgi:hypothetical protein